MIKAMSSAPDDTRLLFVYNADSGLLNALKDALHKALAPDTYGCSLCATTYGAVSMKAEWREYVERLPYPAIFLHRDELRRDLPAISDTLPAIFLQQGSGVPSLLVGSAELTPGQSVAQLTALLDQRLASQNGQTV